jgi:hypothetical protein
MRMRHIITYGLTSSKKFLRIISKTHDYEKKVTEHEKRFEFLYIFCLKHFLF